MVPGPQAQLPIAIVNQGAASGLLLAGLLIPLVTRPLGLADEFLRCSARGRDWCVLWLFVGREGNLAATVRKAAR